MAGAGKKTFVAGTVLTASDVNSYLMDQAVMRFSSSAVRASELPTPSEGMMSYLDDTNQVEVYDGAAWGQVSASIPGNIPHAQFATSIPPTALGFSKAPNDSVSVAATITFPAGRFSVAPHCFTTPGDFGAGSYRCIYTPVPTSSAVTVYLANANVSASVASVAFTLQAVQMLSGSASG
jgi:hypothetical protein